MPTRPRALRALVFGGAAGVAALAAVGVSAGADPGHRPTEPAATASATATPIEHLVVLFDENVSFDHYFGTYPYATNPAGSPRFTAAPGTPDVNGLYDAIGPGGPTGPLMTDNPNASNPVLLSRADAMTCDQDHGYAAEQQAVDHGAMDGVVAATGHGVSLGQCLSGLTTNGTPEPLPAGAAGNAAVMDYYDGNTVTALWNYAQHFTLADNGYGTTYGPSTPGALNVTSANTYGSLCGPAGATINDSPCGAPSGLDTTNLTSSVVTAAGVPTAPGAGTDVSDTDPNLDICSYLPSAAGGDGRTPAQTMAMGGPNVGTALDAAGVSWGWFQGGFSDGYVPGHGTPPTTAQVCGEHHTNVGGASVTDYIPHHDPFQYYAATANPMHLPPTSVAAIGRQDQANHQYGLADFWAAADSGNLPAVSYLKAAGYQDGHAGYSDPLDEQTWIVDTVNRLEKLPSWRSTAVVITWDDSDGWYDHVVGPLVSQSHTALDSFCGANPNPGAMARLVPTTTAGQPEQGRCGVGPRIPFLVISPWARANHVDNTLIDQSSVVRFVETNWHLPTLGDGAADATAGSLLSAFDFRGPARPPLFLDPQTGEPVPGPLGGVRAGPATGDRGAGSRPGHV